MKRIKKPKPIIRYGEPLERSEELNELVTTKGLEIGNNNLVRLTKGNSKIIETALKEDDGYFDFSRIVFEYLTIKEGKNRFPYESKSAWIKLIRMIDLVNYTQVWRFRRGSIESIVSFITDPQNKFVSRLKAGDIKLVDEMTKKIAIEQNADIKSLPSKICKYVSEYSNPECGDKYFINDYYIRSMLPYYLDYYKVDYRHIELDKKSVRESLSYEELFNLMDALLNKVNEQEKERLTKNELDHIIWYCYKSYSRK